MIYTKTYLEQFNSNDTEVYVCSGAIFLVFIISMIKKDC